MLHFVHYDSKSHGFVEHVRRKALTFEFPNTLLLFLLSTVFDTHLVQKIRTKLPSSALMPRMLAIDLPTIQRIFCRNGQRANT